MGNCKIVVAGTGYVGLSVACLLAQNNPVSAVEINKEKVEKLKYKDYENYTKTFGDYTVTTEDRNLRLKVARNYDIVGTILTIKALCADGSEGEVKVEVVSV